MDATKIIVCPGCNSQISIVNPQVGMKFQCATCGKTMAIGAPKPSTGIRQAPVPAAAVHMAVPAAVPVAAPIAAPVAAPIAEPADNGAAPFRRGTGLRKRGQTGLRKRGNTGVRGRGGRTGGRGGSEDDGGRPMPPPKKSPLPLILGIAGAAALIGVVIFLGTRSSGTKLPPQTPGAGQPAAPVAAQPGAPLPGVTVAPGAAVGAPGQPVAAPPAPAAASWETGSRDLFSLEDEMKAKWEAAFDADKAKRLDERLKESRSRGGDRAIRDEIIKDADLNLPILIDRVWTDDEDVVREAATLVEQIFKLYQVDGGSINQEKLRMVQYRATTMQGLADWYLKNKSVFANRVSGEMERDSASINLADVKSAIRTGGEMRDQAVATIRAHGRAAYADLINELKTDEPAYTRKICKVLTEVTGQDFGSPTPENYLDIAKKWEDWYNSSGN